MPLAIATAGARFLPLQNHPHFPRPGSLAGVGGLLYKARLTSEYSSVW